MKIKAEEVIEIRNVIVIILCRFKNRVANLFHLIGTYSRGDVIRAFSHLIRIIVVSFQCHSGD